MSTFRSIDELIRVIAREKVLLKEMFAKRKTLSFRYDYARSLVEYKEERIRFLIEYGVIRDSEDCLEMTDVYLRFFEDVLDVNEEINVAVVSGIIGKLEELIQYFLIETNARRKSAYLKDIKGTMRQIAVMTLRNVIDLKRNIDNTYKNEPSWPIKKKKLESLDGKRAAISTMIRECETLFEEKERTFFAVAMDAGLNATVSDVRLQLREVYHNLLELDRQIITYLNLIEYQSRIVEKIRRVKYLSDQMILETQSDVVQRLLSTNPVWMEPRPVYRLKLSLDMLRNTDEGLQALKDAASGRRTGSGRERLAPPLRSSDLEEKVKIQDTPDVAGIRNSFLASGGDLYSFVMECNCGMELSREERQVLFCQIASQFPDEFRFTDTMREDSDIEYQLITPKS